MRTVLLVIVLAQAGLIFGQEAHFDAGVVSSRLNNSTGIFVGASRCKVVQIPVLSDNYAYLLIDTHNNVAAAIDPVEPDKIIRAADQAHVRLESILTTHHHWDHAGGNSKLLEHLGKQSPLPVYGGEKRIEALTHLVSEGDQILVGNVKVQVYSTPCHTKGHVVYYVDCDEERFLFSGDTLFLGGCGKFFEGTAAQMVSALDKIALLPEDTKVMCGHEYSVSNLQFALFVDSDNQAVIDKLHWAQEQQAKGLSTVPSTIKEELSYNPFMRVNNPAIKSAVGLPNGDNSEVMAAVRELKNNFKPKL